MKERPDRGHNLSAEEMRGTLNMQYRISAITLVLLATSITVTSCAPSRAEKDEALIEELEIELDREAPQTSDQDSN